MNAFWNKLKKSKDEKRKDQNSSDVQVEEKKIDKIDRKARKIDEKKKESKKGKDGKRKKSKKKGFPKENAVLIENTIVKPKVSEAAINQQILGKYVFYVRMNATKNEISKAVEAMYGVHVRKVNVQKYSPRVHQFRGYRGLKQGFKKAIVSLSKDESIDVFSG